MDRAQSIELTTNAYACLQFEIEVMNTRVTSYRPGKPGPSRASRKNAAEGLVGRAVNTARKRREPELTSDEELLVSEKVDAMVQCPGNSKVHYPMSTHKRVCRAKAINDVTKLRDGITKQAKKQAKKAAEERAAVTKTSRVPAGGDSSGSAGDDAPAKQLQTQKRKAGQEGGSADACVRRAEAGGAGRYRHRRASILSLALNLMCRSRTRGRGR